MSDAFEIDPSEHTPEVKFEDLVGDGKKYRDQEAAAKAIVEKDRFIEQLKRETAEMREAIAKREKESAFIDKLEALTKAKSPDAQEPPAHDGTDTGATAVRPEDVEKILEAREAKKRREDNLGSAINRLQELYGDDYKRHVSRQAQSLGMTTQELTDLAARSPDAFFRTLGVDTARQTDAFTAPPRSSMSPPPAQAGVKNYAYFDKLRAEKGETYYFSPTVQNEMWNSLKQLGEEAFYKR